MSQKKPKPQKETKPQKKLKPQVVALKKSPENGAKADAGFEFGPGKLQELADAWKKAEPIQKGAKPLQEELEGIRIEAHDANQTITYLCTGHHEPVSIEIQPAAIAKTMAGDLSKRVLAVMRQGYYCSASHMQEKMQALLEPLNFSTPQVVDPTIEGVTAFVRESR